jgi:uncharacterized coiled-coil protein SlyX
MRRVWVLSVVSLTWILGCGDMAPARQGNGFVETSASPPMSLAKRDNSDTPAPLNAAGEKADAASARKIIYTTQVSLVVKDFVDVEPQLRALVSQFQGYVADVSVDRSQGESRSGQWVVRIPAESLETFLAGVDVLGIPEHRRQSAQEVTEEYVDLQSRLANKKRLEERILKLLETASSQLKDIIAVEQELARVREEIEVMEGRLRYLDNMTTLATVTINAREERDYVPPQAPTFANQITSTWGTSLGGLRAFGQGIVLAAVGAAPWLIVVAPVTVLLVAAVRMSRRRERKAAA